MDGHIEGSLKGKRALRGTTEGRCAHVLFVALLQQLTYRLARYRLDDNRCAPRRCPPRNV
jgi:hypothetical protein